jgi:peptidoglycan/LPS O-acetylase OafA/YrhL
MQRPSPVHALTGIRFFAALHVVLFHYAGGALTEAPWWVRSIVACGPSAVGLFYILSGAVLVYSCTTPDGALSSSRTSFWRARFARIYPTYLLALVLDAPFFASALLKTHDGLSIVIWGIALGIPALLLLHAWTPLTVFGWNTPGWSLSAEAFFYWLFPSVAPRLRATRTNQLIRWMILFYALALVSPLLVLAAERYGGSLLTVRVPPGPGGLDLHAWVVRFAGFSPIARVPEFLIGVCLGHWLKVRRGTWSPQQAGLLELVAFGTLAIAWVALGTYPQQSKIWLDSGLLAPVFALVIVALTLGSGPIGRLLATAPLVVLGDASYALYILQEPIVIWTAKVPVIRSLPISLLVLVYLVIVVACSVLCQRFAAEPIRRWLVRSRDVKPVATLQPAGGT